MTLYRLYLRSSIRRDPLSPGEVPCAAAPSPAGREDHPALICGAHRYSYAIAGSQEFEAENDAAALAIARSIAEAAGDLCDAFDLWDGTRQIDQSRMATLPTSVVTAQWQDHVIRAEEALLSSNWAIARSRGLLARLNELRVQAASGDPAATPAR